MHLNAGKEKLLRFEGDGGPDRTLWPTVFPELLEEIRMWRPKRRGGLPVASLPSANYFTIATKEEANVWALSLVSKVSKMTGVTRYGLDTENNRDTSHITWVLSLSFPAPIESRVAVLHLSTMGIFSAKDFPEHLKTLLELPSLVPVAVNVGHDTTRLNALGVEFCSDPREIMDVAKMLEPNHPEGYGMQKLCSRILNLCVDKFGQNADYGISSLSNDLAHCCALDAHLHLVLYNSIMTKIQEAQDAGRLDHSPLVVGKNVLLMSQGANLCDRGS